MDESDLNESDALLGNSPGHRTTPEEVFAQFDADGSGSLSLQEVRDALTKLSLPVDERVERLFRALDTDGNGTLSVAEFKQVCLDMDPSKISSESVTRELDRQASLLSSFGATVADGVATATGSTASSSSSSSSSSSAFQMLCQLLCSLVINGSVSAYAIYVGFKYKADPSTVCRADALWLIVYGFNFIVTFLFPLLLVHCPDKLKVVGATFFGMFIPWSVGWGVYGITLFFHSEAQKCNRELYLFGYVMAIIYIVVLSMVCCAIPCCVLARLKSIQ